jgi:hypothetical protein
VFTSTDTGSDKVDVCEPLPKRHNKLNIPSTIVELEKSKKKLLKYFWKTIDAVSPIILLI